jgi:hypothetical protein
VAVGDYERIEEERRAAYKRMMRAPWGSNEHTELTRQHDKLVERRAAYLRELLAQLPFRWHIAHAYTARETATYGGADHIVVDEPIRIGRLVRKPGDALSRPKQKFLALYAVEEDRLPTARTDIKIAERIVATSPAGARVKKPAKQLNREVAEVLQSRSAKE